MHSSDQSVPHATPHTHTHTHQTDTRPVCLLVGLENKPPEPVNSLLNTMHRTRVGATMRLFALSGSYSQTTTLTTIASSLCLGPILKPQCPNVSRERTACNPLYKCTFYQRPQRVFGNIRVLNGLHQLKASDTQFGLSLTTRGHAIIK